jgi:hypothetical protein
VQFGRRKAKELALLPARAAAVTKKPCLSAITQNKQGLDTYIYN